MSAREFDAAVIGAGPGGAACALAAARDGMRVLLVDPNAGVCDKPCGEGIMPSGLGALEELGIAVSASESFAFRRLRFVHEGRDALEIELESQALSVARPILAARLASALDGEPRIVREQGHASALAVPDGFELSIRSARRTPSVETARARFLVCADGGAGRSAPALRGRAPTRRSHRIGLRARFELADPLEFVEVHIGGGAEVYLTPLAERTVNVAVLLEEEPSGVCGAAAVCDFALERHPRALARLARMLTPPAARALDRARPRHVAYDDVFLVGDAAGAVDPILGCGVALALQSGIAAAGALRARTNGDHVNDVARRYRAQWREMSAMRRELARALRYLSAHPRLAKSFLALLAGAPSLRRGLCRVVAGDARGAVLARAEPHPPCAV